MVIATKTEWNPGIGPPVCVVCAAALASPHPPPPWAGQDAGAAHGGARATDGHLPSDRASGLRAGRCLDSAQR